MSQNMRFDYPHVSGQVCMCNKSWLADSELQWTSGGILSAQKIECWTLNMYVLLSKSFIFQLCPSYFISLLPCASSHLRFVCTCHLSSATQIARSSGAITIICLYRTQHTGAEHPDAIAVQIIKNNNIEHNLCERWQHFESKPYE